jgi:sulfatase modifying factor 1
MRKLAVLVSCSAGASLVATACSHAAPRLTTEQATAAAQVDVGDASFDAEEDGSVLDATLDANVAVAEPPDDPMSIHRETRADLLALIDVRPLTEAEHKVVRPDIFLGLNVGPAVTRFNQGNKAIAKHSRGQRACLAGLQGITIQTEEQRDRCGGPNMVPVYKNGDPKSAAYCIDVFEFPNKPCELPFVWTAPTHAQTMCALEGKRLCTHEEWSLSCRGDPSGGADQTYAYGNDLDLEICNTNHNRGPQNKCSTHDAQTTWSTCSTETEPSGSFPKCRSRFGVFDQHGNVAEVMTRKTKDGDVVTQLKGSAWFYVEVARKPDEPQQAGARETYPDHCNFDPRWHVEPITSAWHVNYHLGFRCCKTITPQK